MTASSAERSGCTFRTLRGMHPRPVSGESLVQNWKNGLPYIPMYAGQGLLGLFR